jgi:hypothetical protein
MEIKEALKSNIESLLLVVAFNLMFLVFLFQYIMSGSIVLRSVLYLSGSQSVFLLSGLFVICFAITRLFLKNLQKH